MGQVFGISMSEALLIDTDVVIDHLRGYGPAVSLVSSTAHHLLLSSITVAEIYQGVRGETDGHEQRVLSEFLDRFEIIPVSLEIATAAGLIRRDYGKSHGVGLADSIIAASANSMRAALKTLNVNHFPMFQGLAPAYTT